MDYEKKYKEALGWMQSVYPTMTGADKEDAEHFFPELKESEDEMIRKEIARFIQMEVEDEIVENKWLAWLEKKGEQKTADKVKPKFHEDEWITIKE